MEPNSKSEIGIGTYGCYSSFKFNIYTGGVSSKSKSMKWISIIIFVPLCIFRFLCIVLSEFRHR